jgi:hypothetical protein
MKLDIGQFHPPSWVGLAASALVMLIIVLPGLPAEDQATLQFPKVNQRNTPTGSAAVGAPGYVREFEHGWPLTFMRRAFGYSISGSNPVWPNIPRNPKGSIFFRDSPLGGVSLAGYEIAWTAPNAWPWSPSDLSEFYWAPAVCDAIVALAIIALFTAGCERWLRRRRSILRWRVVDIVAVVSLIAACLGYWRWAKSLGERDAKLVPSNIAEGETARLINWQYSGPGWLPRLLGTRKPLAFLERIVRLHSSSMQNMAEGWANIGQLSALERLEIDGADPSEFEFDHLMSLRRLRDLSWGRTPSAALAWLPRLTHVQKLTLYKCDIPDADLDRLKQAMPWATIRVRRL